MPCRLLAYASLRHAFRIGDEEGAEHLPQDDRDFLNGATWLCNDPKAKRRTLDPKPAADLKVIAAVANFQQAKASFMCTPSSWHGPAAVA